MNKTEQIVETLRREILAGAYPLSRHFPSEYELSARFSVHKSTANKAVSLLVDQGLLKRGGRGSGTWVARTSGFIRGRLAFVGSLQHPYPVAVLSGMQRMALKHGYVVEVFSPDSDEEEHCLELLVQSGVGGTLICRYGLLFNNAPMPVIHVDNDCLLEGTSLHGVDSDKYQGWKMLMEMILARGHREIAIFTASNRQHRVSTKLQGFHDALQATGFRDITERTFFAVEHTVFEAKQVLANILQRFPELTMLACDSDDRARLIALAAQEIAPNFFRRVSLSGGGNLPELAKLYKITTVDQHPSQLGVIGCSALIDMIENGPPAVPLRKWIVPEIVFPENIARLSTTPVPIPDHSENSRH